MSREEVEKLCMEEADTFDIGLYFTELTLDPVAVEKKYSTAMITNTYEDDDPEIDINDEEIVFHRGTKDEVSYKLDTVDEDTLLEELDSIYESIVVSDYLEGDGNSEDEDEEDSEIW